MAIERGRSIERGRPMERGRSIQQMSGLASEEQEKKQMKNHRSIEVAMHK